MMLELLSHHYSTSHSLPQQSSMNCIVTCKWVNITQRFLSEKKEEEMSETYSMIGKFAAVTGVIGLSVGYGYHWWKSSQRKGEAPVAWSWIPFLGHALEMGKQPTELMQRCVQKYGEIFGLVVLGNRMFFLSDPVNTSVLFRASKDFSVDEFFEVVMVNFFNYNRETLHKHLVDDADMRRFYNKYLFSDDNLHILTNRFLSAFEKYVKKSAPTGDLPLFDTIYRMVFLLSFEALFKEDKDMDPIKMYTSFREFDKVLPLSNIGVHISNLSGPFKSLQQLVRLVEKSENPEENSGFITARWEYLRDLEKKFPILQGEPAKYQVSMLWASTGNSAPAAFWTVYHVLTRPNIRARAIEEIDRILPNMASGGTVDTTSLSKMYFLDACISEMLRFAGSNMIVRKVMKEGATLTLSSGRTYSFRKGDSVGLYPFLFYLDEELFPNATEFNPDRWMVGDTEEELSQSVIGKLNFKKGGQSLPATSVFLPFGSGVTMCPGRKFARNEIKMIVIILLKKFIIEIKPGQQAPVHDASRCGFGIIPPAHDIIASIRPAN